MAKASYYIEYAGYSVTKEMRDGFYKIRQRQLSQDIITLQQKLGGGFSEKSDVTLIHDIRAFKNLNFIDTLFFLNRIMRGWSPQALLDEELIKRRKDLRDFLDNNDPIRAVGIIDSIGQGSVHLRDEHWPEFKVKILCEDTRRLDRRADFLCDRPASVLGLIKKLNPFEMRCAGLFVRNK